VAARLGNGVRSVALTTDRVILTLVGGSGTSPPALEACLIPAEKKGGGSTWDHAGSKPAQPGATPGLPTKFPKDKGYIP